MQNSEDSSTDGKLRKNVAPISKNGNLMHPSIITNMNSRAASVDFGLVQINRNKVSPSQGNLEIEETQETKITKGASTG